jgi:hypothetical protein
MIKLVICADGTPLSLSNIRAFWLRPKIDKATGRHHVYATLNTLVMVDVVSFGFEVCAIEACNVLNSIKDDPTCYGGSRRDTFDCTTDFLGYL